MNHFFLRACGWLALTTLLSHAQTPDRFQFDGLPLGGHANVPFPLRLAAVDATGQTLTNVNATYTLTAYGRRAPGLMITEVSMDGATVELQNPGETPLDVSGWEIEAPPAFRDNRGFPRVQLPAGSVLAPGATFLWSGNVPATNPWPVLGSEPPLKGGFAVLQVRDPAGRPVDQVVFGSASELGVPLRWAGQALGRDFRANYSWQRVGRENRFAAADWVASRATFGQTNPDLQLPWFGTRMPVAVTPVSLGFAKGVWAGAVTLPEGGAHLSLAVDDGSGNRSESALFALEPRPALTLALTAGTNTASEARPGLVAEMTATLPAAMLTNVVVRLISAAPGEFSVSAEAVIPAGNLTATWGVTNHDDSVADGRARVVITALAEGFQSAEMEFFNDDDEAGQLRVQLPRSGREESGFQPEPGRVFLAAPALHDVSVQLSADPLLTVPMTVVVPAGRQSAEFPLRVGTDSFVNRPGRTVAVTARIPGWPDATATLPVSDNEPLGIVVEWPEQTVIEGHPATGHFRLLAPRDYDERLLITGTTDRLQAPAEIPVPAGTTNVDFTITVPDNHTLDAPASANICVRLTSGGGSDCRRLYSLDDEVGEFTKLDFTQPPPEAVFSGEPFLVRLEAVNTYGVDQLTNFTGAAVLTVPPSLAAVSADSHAIPFSNSVFNGTLMVQGEALGAQLDVTAAGLTARSRSLDILTGHLLEGNFLEVAAVPGRDALLLTQLGKVSGSGQLIEVDARTGTIARTLDLPRPATKLAVAEDGSVAWLCSDMDTLQRIDLKAWRFDREVALQPGSVGLRACLRSRDEV